MARRAADADMGRRTATQGVATETGWQTPITHAATAPAGYIAAQSGQAAFIPQTSCKNVESFAALMATRSPPESGCHVPPQPSQQAVPQRSTQSCEVVHALRGDVLRSAPWHCPASQYAKMLPFGKVAQSRHGVFGSGQVAALNASACAALMAFIWSMVGMPQVPQHPGVARTHSPGPPQALKSG
jgi:hypothetical protein